MRKLPLHRSRHLDAEHVNQLAQKYGLGTFLRVHQSPSLWRLLRAELRCYFKTLFPDPFFIPWSSGGLSFPQALPKGPLSLIKWLFILSGWFLLHLLRLLWRLFLLLLQLLALLFCLILLITPCLEIFGAVFFILSGDLLQALIYGAVGVWLASIVFPKAKDIVVSFREVVYGSHILRRYYYECTDGFLVTQGKGVVTSVVRWSDLKLVFSYEVLRLKRLGFSYQSPKMFSVETGDGTKLVIRTYKLGRTAQRRYNRLCQEQACQWKLERKLAQRKLACEILDRPGEEEEN
jgi:hypothetical protein